MQDREDVGFFMQKNKISLGGADKLVIMFFAGIVIGSVIVNIIPFSWVMAMNVWSADYISSFISKTVNYSVMCRYLFKLRGLIMAGLILVMLTPFVKKLLYILPLYLGAAWGMVSSIIMMEHGINGVRVCFFLIFPHFIFYMAGIGMMLYKILLIRNSPGKRVDFTFVMVFVFAGVTIAAGVMAEAYINVSILPLVLRQFA